MTHELHMFSGEASASDVVKAIERLAQAQGGYTWRPRDDGEIVVPERIKKKFNRLNLAPMAKLVAEKQSCRQD